MVTFVGAAALVTSVELRFPAGLPGKSRRGGMFSPSAVMTRPAVGWARTDSADGRRLTSRIFLVFRRAFPGNGFSALLAIGPGVRRTAAIGHGATSARRPRHSNAVNLLPFCFELSVEIFFSSSTGHFCAPHHLHATHYGGICLCHAPPI